MCKLKAKGVLNEMPADPSAYAQRAIFRLMKGGEWYTIRQISELCKLSDPRGNISHMRKRGYVFEYRWEFNSHNIRYKYWRLIVDADTASEPDTDGKGIQKLYTESIQKLYTADSEKSSSPNI